MKSPALLLAICALTLAGKIIAADPPPAKIETAVKARTLEGHTGSVLGVIFSPDGKVLATGSRDKTIKLWDPKSGELKRTLTGHTGHVESLTFSPDGTTLVTGGGGGDTSVRIWDMTGNP